MWTKCLIRLKIVTILPLKILFMSNLCCQKALEIVQNLQQNFWTWVWQHVSVIHCWVEPSLLLSSYVHCTWINEWMVDAHKSHKHDKCLLMYSGLMCSDHETQKVLIVKQCSILSFQPLSNIKLYFDLSCQCNCRWQLCQQSSKVKSKKQLSD